MTGTELVERFKGAIAADSRRVIAEAIEFMIAAEREACAQIADDKLRRFESYGPGNARAQEIAAAIRARGETS